MNVGISAYGHYLPKNEISNDFFTEMKQYTAEMDDFFDGVQYRRHAELSETSRYMGLKAAENCLMNAKKDISDIDYLLFYSVIPDNICPNDGNSICSELGAKNIKCWNIDTACASMLTMFQIANMLVSTGNAKRVLTVAVTNWVNRGLDKTKNFKIHGDGASATLIEANAPARFLGFKEKTYPQYSDLITLPSATARQDGQPHYFSFGKTEESKSFMLNDAVGCASELMAELGLKPTDIDWFIPHQSGFRLSAAWSTSLGIDPKKILSTLPWTGNMSAANIPVVLEHFLYKDPLIQKGQRVLFFSPGAGLHTSSAIIQLG